MGVIVIGVDHSDGAKAALRFALEEAELRQGRLRAVHAWRFGYVGASGIEGAFPVLGAELNDLRGAAEAALEATLQEVVPDTSEVEIERRVVEGTPAAVLVDESRDAELLVVGSRGLWRAAARLGQPAVCPPRGLPGRDRSRAIREAD